MLWCAELSLVVQIIKKLLRRRGTCIPLCRGETGIVAPSEVDSFQGECCCKMFSKVVSEPERLTREPDICW